MAWHLPLPFLAGSYHAFGGAGPEPLVLLAGILRAGVLYAWVYANTDRCVLAVVTYHFVQSYTGELLGMSPAARGWEGALLVLAAAGVAWRWGPQTLRGKARMERGV